ncbi:MAG: Wzz/FepE/Etk N-terminal domain-containing protein [bacterium]
MLELVPEGRHSKQFPTKVISLRDILYVVFRRRWIILGIALPIILVGGISLFRQTGSYTSASRILVQLLKADQPQWNSTGRNLDYDRELSTLYNIAMSVPVGNMAATVLEDSIPVIRSLIPKLEQDGFDSLSDLREFLVTGLDVSVVGESNILEFRFSSAHPRVSLMAVGALRDAFVEYQVFGLKNTRAVAYYDEQIQIVRSQIDSLLDYRGSILLDSGYGDFQEDLRYDTGQLSDLENQLLRATTNRQAIEQDHSTLISYLQRDPREFPMGQDESSSETLIYWRNMVSKYEDQLNSALTIHTEESIPVRRQRQLLEDSLERLRLEEKAYIESVAVLLASARNREETLRDQVAILQEKNRKIPDLYQKISLIDVEITSLRGLLDDMRGKWGEVRLNQYADERVSPVVKLTDPELVMVLSGGKTMVYFIMIFFLALALGMVAAFVLDNLDHRIYAPLDVEEKLQLPVFASVSRTD